MAKPSIRAKIRRLYVPDAVYFITCVTAQRQPTFNSSAKIQILRTVLHRVKELYPFAMRGYVFLPDHFHLLFHLPATTSVSELMQSFKRNATLEIKRQQRIEKPLAVWQRGYWDHVIRNDSDFETHLHYIHYNPVRHGLVTCAGDYFHSSFHEYVRRGWYKSDWGCDEPHGIAGLDYE
jgi:putative transposase